MNEGFTEKVKSIRLNIKSINQISFQSKNPLNRTLEIDDFLCTRRKTFWAFKYKVAQLSSIRWWKFVREIHWGS